MSICLSERPPVRQKMAYKIRAATALEDTFGVRKTYFSHNVNFKSNLSRIREHVCNFCTEARDLWIQQGCIGKEPKVYKAVQAHNMKNHVERVQ